MRRYTLRAVSAGVFVCCASYAGAVELKTAAQDATPKYIQTKKDGKEAVEGLCIDVLRAIEKVDPEIKFVGDQTFVPMRRIEDSLASGDLDAFVGFLKNEERLAKYVFIDIPAFRVKAKFAVNADDDVVVNSLDDIRKLGKDGIVLSLFGTAYEAFIRKQPGLIVDTSAKGVAQNLKKLSAKRARFFYYHDIGLIYTIKQERMEKEIKLLPFVLHEENQYLALSKKVPKAVVDRVTAALKKLQADGELKRIQSKYDK